MKKIFMPLILFCLFFTSSMAQQSLGTPQNITSPEIHQDKSVTFRVLAPDADEVKLSGDWMPAEGWTPGSVSMEKGENGVWSYKTTTLEPELYSYWFMIDGIRTPDLNNPFMIRDVASVMNVFIIGGEQADLYKVNDVPHGTVARRWYDSPTLGKQRRLTIYTPPGYENSTEQYPVLYLLHGAGGDEEAWITLGRTAQIMDNLIAEGKAKPMIVVMPNGNVSQSAAPGEGLRGFYKPQFMIPNTMDGNYEASFPDIMKFVESNYRIVAEKENRAIAGLSMGGFHSLHISRYYPNTFDYVGLFSAAILPSQDKSHAVYNNIEETLERQKENGYELYWIGMGKTDFLYDAGKEYRAMLDQLDFDYVYRESEGGHIWKNWRVYLSEFVPLLFK